MSKSSDLLNLVANAIEAHPEHHDQNDWVQGPMRYAWEDAIDRNGLVDWVWGQAESAIEGCGTSLCVAGWGIALAPKVAWTKDDLDMWHAEGLYGFSDIAARMFGLRESTASSLFYAFDLSAEDCVVILRTLAAMTDSERYALHQIEMIDLIAEVEDGGS